MKLEINMKFGTLVLNAELGTGKTMIGGLSVDRRKKTQKVRANP